MKYFSFQDGDKIPAIGLGTWRAEGGDAYKAVRSAIEVGYRHFDCAFLYQNEYEIGKALNDALKAGDVKREELFITSKLWNNAHRKEDVKPALQESLKMLNLGYLDLYLIHWPVAWKKEFFFPEKGSGFYHPGEIPLTETWEAMIRTKEDGLTKHIGVSNFNMIHIKEIAGITDVLPEMNQIESHPYLAQELMRDYAHNHNILLTAYKPLGSGGIISSAMKEKQLPGLLQHPVIQKIAEQTSSTPSQVVLAWQINRGFAVIPKSTDRNRQAENLKAAELVLSHDQMSHLNTLDSELRLVDGTAFTQGESPYTLQDIWGDLT